ncbi:MAG: flagellar hook-length control protein FliK, partial [Myxococcota bacterium]
GLFVRRGTQEMTVKLPGLGDVRVRMETNGLKVALVLQSADPRAAAWLKENAAAVTEGLAQRGLSSAQVEIKSEPSRPVAQARGGEATGDGQQNSENANDETHKEREAFAAAVGRRYRDAQELPQSDNEPRRRDRIALIA